MRAIFIDIQRPLESKLQDPLSVQDLGEASISMFNRLSKPRREFSVRSWDTLLHQQIELIRNEIQAARSNAVFFMDGDKWGSINEPMFVANGNGVQKQFPLPVDNVYPSSCKFWDGLTLKTDWTLISDPATVVFTSAPTSRITFIGKRFFRVILTPTEGNIMQESQLYSHDDDAVYSMAPLNFTEVEAVNRS